MSDEDSIFLLWTGETPPATPFDLHGRGERGKTKLVWRTALAPGRYALELRCATATGRTDFLVRLDHREIAFHSAYYTRDGKAEAPAYAFPFLVAEPGPHEIELDCRTGTFPLKPSDHDGVLRVTGLALRRLPAPGRAAAAAAPTAGAEFQHGWGWQAVSDYQRLRGFVLTRDYWIRRVVNESAKWGANYIQLYPAACAGYFADAPVREGLRDARRMGMLIDEHAHEDRFLQPIEPLYAAIRAHLAETYDVLARDPEERPDVFETEQYAGPDRVHVASRENFIRTDRLMWAYHPGGLPASCLSAPGENDYYLQWLHEDFHGPNYAHFLMCAGGAMLGGYDDMDAMALLPNDLGFRNPYNWVYRGCQANARPYSNNLWGGTSSVDWLAKQHGDFFRLNARAIRDGRLPLNSFLAWLGEDLFTLPEDLREAVYAVSLDPCRAALAYRLATTGRDGEHAWRKRHHKQAGGQVVPRPREWAASTTLRLHNGILAADHGAFGDRRKLRWDAEQLGHFDLNAQTLTLAHAFFELAPDAPEPPAAAQVFESGSEPGRVWRVRVPTGTYELRATAAGADAPFRAEFHLMGQFLGSLAGGAGEATERFPCFVSDDHEHPLELRLADGERLPRISVEFLPTHCRVEALAVFGPADDAAVARAASAASESLHASLPKRRSVSASDARGPLPRFLSGRGEHPRALDIWFDGEAGSYLLAVRARSETPQHVDVTLNSHRFSTPELVERVRRDGAGAVSKPADWPAWLNPNDWLSCPGEYGRIHAFDAVAEWRTFHVPIVCAHDGGSLRHKIELSVPAGGGDVALHTIGLYQDAVERRIERVGGHEAVVEERLARTVGGATLTETRRLRLVADEPTLFLDVEREASGGPVRVKYLVDGSAYARLEFDGEAQPPEGFSAGVPERIAWRDPAELRPPLTLLLLRRDGIEGLRWSGGRLELTGVALGRQRLAAAATLRDPAGKGLAACLAAGPEDVRLGGDGHTLVNRTGQTEVRLVRVVNPEPGPYFVREQGWWGVRGAQPLKSSGAGWARYLRDYEAWRDRKGAGVMPTPPCASDLIRLSVAPGDEARLQRYGYMDGVVRPGWGSQKQMAIADVRPEQCTVRVLSVTPYVYAPRVEFAGPFAAARLDGEPWAYHDGRHVFLPQQPGDYRVEVTAEGARTPTVTATAARIESARYEDGTLTVRLAPPPYVFALPDGLHYTIAVVFDGRAFAISKVEGGAIARTGPRGAIVECRSDIVCVRFVC